jgi:hypothetical protein
MNDLPARLRFLSVLSLLLAALSLGAQDRTPVFHATSELVLVDVQVLHNRNGSPTPALQARDFQVSEEGVPQQILHFWRGEFPLSVVLLFDLTDSSQAVLKRLAAGAETALAHFKPADEVAVMAYPVTPVCSTGSLRIVTEPRVPSRGPPP